nr:hypothetical protein [uncultured Dyadobacter sp.]
MSFFLLFTGEANSAAEFRKLEVDQIKTFEEGTILSGQSGAEMHGYVIINEMPTSFIEKCHRSLLDIETF